MVADHSIRGSATLAYAEAEITRHMAEIANLFMPGAKISVLVRNPAGERVEGARDFVLTNDDLPEIVRMVERRAEAERAL